jgi:hypothetical protein
VFLIKKYKIQAFAVTSMIMVTFSLASAFAPWGNDGDVALMVIAVARFGNLIISILLMKIWGVVFFYL